VDQNPFNKAPLLKSSALAQQVAGFIAPDIGANKRHISLWILSFQ
jgi:hypothetical protein